MRRSTGALLATVLTLSLPAPSRAQEVEAYVLPPGVVRLSAGGEYSAFDQLFGEGGGQDLGSRLGGPLVPASFVPLRPLEASLAAFLEATAGSAGATPFSLSPGALSLGDPDLSVFLSRVRVPLRLEVGIAPRVQIGVSLPLVRGEIQVQRFGLSGATVGPNPDPAGNAALLGRVGGNGGALGASDLLPTAGSEAGEELQRRVRGATGEELDLPTGDSVDADVIQPLLVSTFAVDSLHAGVGPWLPGDLQVEARVTLLDQVGASPLPLTGEGTAYRLALSAAVRLPTGVRTDSLRLFPRDPELGLAGGQIALAGDAFIGERWWIGFSAREVLLTSTSVTRRVVSLDAPLSSADPARPVDWNPPDTLEIAVSPRMRVARVIALGLDYRGAWQSASSFGGDAAVLDTPGGLTHWLGVVFRFTSVPTFIARETGVPIEVSAGYGRNLSGPEGASAHSAAYLRGSILPSLWGRGLRR